MAFGKGATWLILAILLFSFSFGQTVSVGVIPSSLELDFTKSQSIDVKIKLFNEKGNSDGYFSIYSDDLNISCKNVNCSKILVKKGSSIQKGYTEVTITIQKAKSGNYCIYVEGSPVNAIQSGGLIVKPRICISTSIIADSTTQKPRYGTTNTQNQGTTNQQNYGTQGREDIFITSNEQSEREERGGTETAEENYDFTARIISPIVKKLNIPLPIIAILLIAIVGLVLYLVLPKVL